MKGTRHSEEQIIVILKQGEAGLTTAELCRQHGITELRARRNERDAGLRVASPHVKLTTSRRWIAAWLFTVGFLHLKCLEGCARDCVVAVLSRRAFQPAGALIANHTGRKQDATVAVTHHAVTLGGSSHRNCVSRMFLTRAG
jgi:hypothetical protein